MFRNYFLFVLAAFAGSVAPRSGIAQSAQPLETLTISTGAMTLADGQMISLPLPDGWRWIKAVYVQAVGAPSAAKAEIIVNGERRGDLMDVPPQQMDPNFSRDIRETARSIDIRSVHGAVRIFDVKVVVAAAPRVVPPVVTPTPPQPSAYLDDLVLSYPVHTNAQRFSVQALELSKLFFARTQTGTPPAVTVGEYEQHILPIKKVAGRAYGLSQSRRDVSAEVQTLLLALQAQILSGQNAGFFDALLGRHIDDEPLFNLVTATLALEKRLEAELR